MNIWPGYKQERGCLVHFVCLANALLKDEERAREWPRVSGLTFLAHPVCLYRCACVAKTAEPIETSFDGRHARAEETIYYTLHISCAKIVSRWRHPENAIERFVRSGDAVFSKITLTTRYYNCSCYTDI